MITAIDPDTALVLIDLQKGIVNAKTVHPVTDIINRVVFLAEAFREAGLPVFIIHVNPTGAAWTRTRVASSAASKNAASQTSAATAMQNTGFTEIIPEIAGHAGDVVILKKTWNAFFNTRLLEELKKRSVTGIVLAGISTSVGVEGTARAASELGYNISFAIDAMTDRQPDAHDHSIKNIFPRIGELGNAAEIVAKLPAKSV